jgi:hypothetical protein
MGRIVLTADGAARRPAHRWRPVLFVIACVALYIIGYVAVATLMKGN